MRKSKIFIFSFSIFLFLKIFSFEYEHNIEMQYVESGNSGIDYYYEIIDPLFNWKKSFCEFAIGNITAELNSKMKIKVIYDTNSVIPGESLLIKIVVSPEKSSNYTIYSNFGAVCGIGLKTKFFGTLGGIWLTGPSLSADFNINIESNDNPPLGLSEKAIGDDVVDFLSLIPDISNNGKVSTIKDFNRNILPFYPKDGSFGASSVLTLFDILSLKLSGGFKISDGEVILKIRTDENILKMGYTEICDIKSRNDTIFLKVFVDSFASLNSVGKIYFDEPEYRVNFYRRIGLYLSSFGVNLISTYWIDNNFYENLGERSLLIPSNVQKRYLETPIIIKNNLPDLVLDRLCPIPKDFWGNNSSFVQSNVPTNIVVYYKNLSSQNIQNCKIRLIINGTISLYATIDSIKPGENDSCVFEYIFPVEGLYKIESEINYDKTINEFFYENNKNEMFFYVVTPTKHIEVFLLDSLNHKYNDFILKTFKTKNFIDTLITSFSDTTFHSYVPGNDTITFSFIPDTLSNYSQVSYSLITTNLPIDNNIVSIKMKRYARMSGSIFNNKGEKVPNCKIMIGGYSMSADSNGFYNFERIVPLSDTLKYLVKITHPVLDDYFEYISVNDNENITKNFYIPLKDSIPPVGNYSLYHNFINIDSKNYILSTKKPILKFSISDDYAGVYSVLIKTPSTEWKEYKSINYNLTDSIFVEMDFEKPIHNGWTYFTYRFKDLAGNLSSLKEDSILMIVDGPNGDVFAESSIVYSPSVKLRFNASDSLLPVRYIKIEGVGSFTYPYSSEIVLNIPDEPGLYKIIVTFANSEMIWGEKDSIEIVYNEKGVLNINNGDDYTSSENVDLMLISRNIKISNISIDSFDFYDGYTISQTFVPHTNLISGISVKFAVVDSPGVYMALYSDTLMPSHQPNRLIAKGFIPPSGEGWKSVFFENPIILDSNSIYHIVLYTDTTFESIYSPYMSGTVYVDIYDSIYSEGTTYISPCKTKGWIWMPYNKDLNFKIYTPYDSIWVSNYSDFKNKTVFFTFGLKPWTLNNLSGYSTVYGKFFYGGTSVGVGYDGIILDKTPPYNCYILINRGRNYTESPICSVFCYFKEDLSETVFVELNGVNFGSVENGGYKILTLTDTLVDGTKEVKARFFDKSKNYTPYISDFIDLDRNGKEFNALFNNSTSIYLPSRFPTLNIITTKSIIPDSIRFSENIVDKGNFRKFQSSFQCTLSSISSEHTLFIELMDNYGKITRKTLYGIVDSTPPVGYNSVSDEGTIIPYKNNLSFYLDGNPQDYESDILGTYGLLKDEDGILIDSFKIYPFMYSFERYNDYKRYKKYFLNIFSVNNAGIKSSYISTDGIIFDSPPDSVVLISPINFDQVSSRPTFVLKGFDEDPDTVLKYKVEIATDSQFVNIVNVFDMNNSTNLWSKESYAPQETVYLYIDEQNAFDIGKKYYWRAYINDPYIQKQSNRYGSFICEYQGLTPSFNLEKRDTIFSVKISSPFVYRESFLIKISVPQKSYLKVNIVDIKGSFVKNIFDGTLDRGGYIFDVKLKDQNSKDLSKGTFFVVVKYNGKLFKKKFQFF